MEATRANDIFVEHAAIGIAGRVMFSLIFFLSGITHFTGMQDYINIMPEAIPLATHSLRQIAAEVA